MDDDVLVTRICEALGAADVGTWNPAPGATYPTDATAIVYGPLPTAPDRAVGVTLYGAAEDVPADGYPLQWRRVQIRFRGAKGARAGADSLASRSYAAMTALSRTAGINTTKRVLVAPMGADGNGRTERADSYLITLDNPEA